MIYKEYPKVRRGEIFYADLGETVGSEQYGVRPVLIIQNDKGNENGPTTVVVGITSKLKKMHLPTHLYLGKRFGLSKESVLIAEQIITLDRQRIKGYIGTVDDVTMERVEEAIEISLGMKPLRGWCNEV